MSDAIDLVSVVIPVRNPTASLAGLLESLAQQRLPAGTNLEVVVVDDGSTNAIEADPQPMRSYLSVRAIRRHPGGNRSAARNAGALEGRGGILVFLDADCRPLTSNFISLLREALASGSTVCAGGPIHGSDQAFWGRYQSDVQASRQRRGAANAAASLTAANLAVKRNAFLDAGGFDEGYVGYGFEDRDLILRLASRGDVAWIPQAAVSHEDAICLLGVARKLCDAGRVTSLRFCERHPATYRLLGYAAMDTELHPWLASLAPTLGRLALSSAPHIDRWLAGSRLPYPVGKLLVKAVCAASFLYGTSLRNRSA